MCGLFSTVSLYLIISCETFLHPHPHPMVVAHDYKAYALYSVEV